MPGPLVLTLYAVLWAVVLIEAVVLCTLARKVFGLGSALLTQVANDGLPLGTKAPHVRGVDTLGEPYELGGSAGGLRAVMFLAPGCPGCRMTMRWLPIFVTTADYSGHVVVLGEPKAVRQYADEYQFAGPMIPDPKGRIMARFRVTSSPFLMVLDSEGRVIGKGMIGTSRDAHDVVRVALMRARMGGIPQEEKVEAGAV